MIVRDLMVGNPRLAKLGFGEEALGHNAILAGFQGQRQWTDHYPERRFPGSHPDFLLRLERHPRAAAWWPRRTIASTASACCSATC